MNNASIEKLRTLPRVGSVLAKNIYEFIQQRGGIREVWELRQVPGMAEKTLQRIAHFIVIYPFGEPDVEVEDDNDDGVTEKDLTEEIEQGEDETRKETASIDEIIMDMIIEYRLDPGLIDFDLIDKAVRSADFTELSTYLAEILHDDALVEDIILYLENLKPEIDKILDAARKTQTDI